MAGEILGLTPRVQAWESWNPRGKTKMALT